MSQDIIKGTIKEKITSDLILQLYDEMKQMPEGEEKQARQAVIEVLSEHLGEWLMMEQEKKS